MAIDRGILIVVLMFITNCTSEQTRCTYINYRGKNNTKYTTSTQNHNDSCPSYQMCKRRLSISYIDIPPYSTSHLFESIVEGCCGILCTNFHKIDYFNNISQVQLSHDNSSDFILPLLGSSVATNLFGYYFIPFVNAPDAYYITPKHASPMSKLLKNMVGMVALIVLCLLSSIISGFIIWLSETFFSYDHVDYQPFFSGVFEGFWWSFTVVTSGYGAKVVKTVPAKVFSVIWILFGIVMFSLMSSSFTAELMNIMGQHYDSIAGNEVGVLQFRDYDASLVVRVGGVIRETKASNFHEDVIELIRILRKGEVDGILLDRYSLVYTKGFLEWKKNNLDTHSKVNKDDIDYFLKNTDSTLVEYKGEKLSYGVLVKNQQDYVFLDSAVRDNRLSLETLVESKMNEVYQSKKPKAIIDPAQSVFFWNLAGWTAVIIGGISVFGIFYEICHHFLKQKERTIGDDTINCLSGFVTDVKTEESDKNFSLN